MVHALHLTPIVFDAFGFALTRTEITELLDRLRQLYEHTELLRERQRQTESPPHD